MASTCVPPDGFWRWNRDVAENIWQRGDGATISTRVAESINSATGIPVRSAKQIFHAATSVAVGKFIHSATNSQVAGWVAGMALYAYLDQDRCK
ncbi:MAG: hypothetical protein R3B48_23660 [Kofleriaceae bacterium]